jgi:Questin oxidase-like
MNTAKECAMNAPSYAALDEALETLSGYGAALKNGNSNHAPMVAEALCAAGRPDAVMPWVTRYRDRTLPRPAARERISSADWRTALGKRDRFTDWALFFREELQMAPRSMVLDRWVARLAPGFCAAATHGAIRVGHAVRGLAAAETSFRMRELADALASWAATYQELPSDRRAANKAMTSAEAIIRVPVIPPEKRRNPGSITASLAMLGDFPEFGPVIGMIGVGGDLDLLLSDLTHVFARVYLANAHDVQTTIVFIHGVTSLTALGSIIPLVSDTTARSALSYAWQSGCALYACFGGNVVMAQDIAPDEQDDDSIIDRAVANGDEHVIKFTEACLRRNALCPSPVFRAAVDNALGMIAPR